MIKLALVASLLINFWLQFNSVIIYIVAKQSCTKQGKHLIRLDYESYEIYGVPLLQIPRDIRWQCWGPK
jgi:hypothetical protein